MKDYDVTDISGTPSGQMLNYRASDDGDWLFVQAGGGPDVSGPTLSIITFDNTLVSDGASSQTFINFDFLQDICEGATITEARLKLFADTNTPGHSASAVDNNCILLQRGFSAWDEGSMSTTLPFVSGINVSFLDSPTSPYQNYDLDVTILTNDIVANGGFGFAMIPQCSDKNIELHFASKDHPNPALHPQLVLTIDDSNCSEPSLLGECCHEIDITNDCPTDFFTSLELKSITPGVNIGSHATGGSMPQDWSVSNSTPNCVAWTHNSGYIPPGTTADLIQFCLDDIDPGETPQDVVLNWYALDGNGEPYIACSDTIRFECEPPIDNPCITVIDTDIKSSPCDSLDCYETPWCVQWLRDTIGAQVGLPEILSYNSVEKGIWNGQVVFVATNPTPPGAANIGNTDIYLCNGTLIQKCEITLFGEVCNPTQSINPSTDITGKMLIWQTGDTVPPLDPDCASGSGSQNTVDVCLTFKNSSQHFADQFIIYPITSGVSYWPNPISLLPTGSIPCDTSTVTFQLFGSAITPGTTVKFGVRLADTQNPDSWCCFESDTVCVVIPECPMTDDCCASQDTFDMLVNQGFQVTQDDCSITVCANQFDTCHYFSNLSPDWGDGSIILPTVLQSNPPNNCWSYTYTTPGSYVITLPVWEGDIDDACWSDVLSYTFECPPSVLPCDSLIVTNGPSTNVDSVCCSTFTIDNMDPNNRYKGVAIRTTPPVSISQVRGLNGYVVNQLTPFRAEVLIPSGSMPLGQQDIFTLCTTDYGAGPHNVTVHWLQQVGNDCVEVCPSDLPMECSDDDGIKCFEFIQDSIQCETETYCFQIKNASNPSFDIASVILYGVNGGTLSPTSVTIPNGPLVSGDTSAWICVNYTGSAVGDTVCYSIAAENAVLPGQSNICCTDTLVQCFVVPPCPTMDDCCASQDTFDMLVNQGFQVTQDDCSITVCANQFDTCHYFSNLSPDWGDGSIILPTVLQSNPPNNCWSYTYTTPGSYVITLPVWEGDIDDACWSDVLSYTFECDTLQPAVCAACPDGQVQGPNLLVNGDFEAGNTGFTNGYTYQSSGALGVGDYSVRTSTTLANAAWAATDYTTGTGQFLTVDGIPGVPFWQNTVTTIPGQDYSLCLFYDHLVAPRLLDFGNASIEVIIDGSTVATVLVNQLPDAWQNITVNYTAISASTNLQLQLAAGSAGFQDVAIDNISFTACGVVVTDPCCDVTEEDFCDEFDVGINYSLNGCELCLPFVLDSCEYLNINYGDGTVVSLNGGGVAPCYTYPGPSGSYTVSVDYFRLDSNQDTCLRKTAVLDIITACPPSASSCLSVIDGNLDCDQGAYCFRITNNTTDTMWSLAFIELTASIALSPDPYRLQAPLAPGVTSEEICLTYIGAFQGDTVCFDVVGHREDITIGEDPIFCCQDTTPVCFVVDCPVVSSTCISVVEDSIDCATQTYCIRVANNTFFDINSIAFHRFSAGHSLSPDPLGIPTLIPGDTSSWICLTYLGASAGDSVCYNIVGHEQDLSSGQEPIFCCSDETTYCFEVACDTDPCCDVSSGYLDSLITTGSDIIIDQCEVTLPFLPDTCATLSIDFGDGDMWQSTGTDTVRHTYMNDGIYDLDITIQYFNDEGAICAEVSDNLEIEIQDCGMGRLCQLDDLTIYNALTPNDDGYNDVLVIDGNSTCQLDILIYNRWGQLVYRGDDYQNDWKGTSLSGDNLAEGTYFLIVNLTDGSGESVDSRQTYIDIRK
jgi:gliding motility-associated-like protein